MLYWVSVKGVGDRGAPESQGKADPQYICKMLESRGYPPSVREIGLAVNLKSSSTVHGY